MYCIYLSTCLSVCVSVCLSCQNMYICVHCPYISTCRHTHCMTLSLSLSVYTYVYTYLYVYIYIYTHTQCIQIHTILSNDILYMRELKQHLTHGNVFFRADSRSRGCGFLHTIGQQRCEFHLQGWL